MVTSPIVPTGNPILDNPMLKNALAAQMAAKQAPPPPAMMPPANLDKTPIPSLPTSTPAPVITGPKKGQMMQGGKLISLGTPEGDELERQRLMTQGPGISQIANRIEDSGLGQKHPILGKVLGIGAEGLAQLGNIALDTTGLGRNLAYAIPGTEQHHELLLNQANAAVNQDVANQAKQAQTQSELSDIPLHQAQAAEAQMRTAQLPQQLQLQLEQMQRQNKLTDAQIQHYLNPQATNALELWRQENPTAPISDFFALQEAAKPHVQTPEEQFIADYQKANPKATMGDAIHAYAIASQRPLQVNVAAEREHEGQDYIVPDGHGGQKLVRIYPGEPIPAGSVTQADFAKANTPTTQELTAAGRAKTVLQMMPTVLNQIDQDANLIGPLSGRWNEFMQKKIGSNDPRMADLRTNLMMMSSAVALAHAVGRLPENLREEFDQAINAPNQTPENLKATIEAIRPWMELMQEMGEGAGQNVNAAPANTQATASPQQEVSLKKAMALPINKGKTEAQVRADLQKYGYRVIQ